MEDAGQLVSHIEYLQCVSTIEQKKKIGLILFFINQKYRFSLKVFNCYTKMMWKQNDTSSMPQIRGVNAYFQFEFITWSIQ